MSRFNPLTFLEVNLHIQSAIKEGAEVLVHPDVMCRMFNDFDDLLKYVNDQNLSLTVTKDRYVFSRKGGY